jgi:hypothetical protein
MCAEGGETSSLALAALPALRGWVRLRDGTAVKPASTSASREAPTEDAEDLDLDLREREQSTLGLRERSTAEQGGGKTGGVGDGRVLGVQTCTESAAEAGGL